MNETLTARIPVPLEDLVSYGKKIQNFEFFMTARFNHRDELTYLMHCMSLTAGVYEPDNEDDFDTLTFWIEDVIRPMRNYLDQNDLVNFPEEYIQRELKRRKEFWNSELGKKIMGDSDEI